MDAKVFTAEDQAYFACLSGDYNPVHTDPLYARRTIFGETVVHGIHILLWALEWYSETLKGKKKLKSINVDFRNPLYLDEPVVLEISDSSVIVKKYQMVILKISNLEFEEIDYGDITLPARQEKMNCDHLTFEEAQKRNGSLNLYLDPDELAAKFPRLSATFYPVQIATILATTRLVGMTCPGKNSIYRALRIDFSDNRAQDSCLRYKVEKADERFSLLVLAVNGNGVSAKITTQYRPELIKQAAMQEVERLVEKDVYKNQRALIIGGSRGLGEVTAKILAAGGAGVNISYFKGQSEAEHVVDEINNHVCKTAECFHYDTLEGPAELDQAIINWQPTHLYYFASPSIFKKSGQKYSEDRFELFCRYYCDGLFKMIERLYEAGLENLKVFYPSTVFLNDECGDTVTNELIEYIAAKAAGEAICQRIESIFPTIKVACVRLPRMLTDQNISLTSTRAAEPIQIMTSLLDDYARR